jgi:hypothetical protein
MPHVTATILDENTLSVNGTTFKRQSGDEVLLQPVDDARAPRLRCSNCHFERGYTFWYKRIGFKDRQISFCPGCGFKIMGVVNHGRD